MLKLAATEHADPLPDLGAGTDGVEQLEAWRSRVRTRLSALLGPSPTPVPLRIEISASISPPTAGGRYERVRCVWDSDEWMSVPAELLVPVDRTEPGPAVLAIHGHGPGRTHICQPPSEGPGGYAHDLAERGYVVLAPDLRCFGERADWNPPDHYACDTNLVHAVMAGESPLAANLWDLARGLDVLADHPLVDPDRLAVVGFSYGATCALFLAALDDRVAAAVVSGYLSSVAASHRVPWNMCGSQVLPGMLGHLEHLDVAALVAPRPLLIQSGREDDIFPLPAALDTVAQLQRVFAGLDAADHLRHNVWEGGHEWHGPPAYAFLEELL
jgi:dienelactone hydrolase